jgi:signal transduction histidine kinase
MNASGSVHPRSDLSMTSTTTSPSPSSWDRAFHAQLVMAAGLSVLVTAIWAMAGAGYLWPRWVWIGLAIPLAFQYRLSGAWQSPPGARRRLGVHWALVSVVAPLLVVIWASADAGYFWPMWPLLGLAVIFSAHAALDARPSAQRETVLSHRVETLTASRRGALDTQAAELRRIERDLHDGAQARLVSLGINLGMAEHLLADDPQRAAGLLADARTANLAALDDLRTLIRGIHPPVLADRGLPGAITALALDLAVPVSVTNELASRAPDPVESAAYFAVAECLANVVKHAHATAATVAIRHRNQRLTIVVLDDGDGGAVIADGGGLAGVGQRLAVFDGTVTIDSPAGGPTIVSLEIPCELSSPKTSPC